MMYQGETHTITKREMTERVAERAGISRTLAKRVMEDLFDEIIEQLSQGNRIEFRDFGVYEIKVRAARRAQNPRTLTPVFVPEKRNAKFKPGRRMRDRIDSARPTPLIEPKTSIVPHTHDLRSHEHSTQSHTLGSIGQANADMPNSELPTPQGSTS